MDVKQYMELFLTESREHLENLNNSLLNLEKNKDDKAALDEIFRSMHTIKGMAATMGFNTISTLSHRTEDLMDKVRKGKISADDVLIDCLFKSFDVLEEMLNKVEDDGNDEIDLSSLLEELLNFQGEKPAPSKQKLNLHWVHVTLEKGCQLKSARAFAVFKSLGDMGTVIDSVPSVSGIKNEDFDLEFKVLIETEEKEPKIKKVIRGLQEIDKVEFSRGDEEKTEIKDKQRTSSLQSVRINIERLDSTVNLVGELIINKARLEDISKAQDIPDLTEAVASNQRLMAQLQYEIMQMRMVPMEQIFNRFPRTVRDISKKIGKEINFVMEGSEIEVDRTALEEIAEPMLHLIRNSVDHGIEMPDERKKLGKKKAGLLKIKAVREKGHINICIEDDGRGINPDAIKEAAIKKGLIEREETLKMTESDVFNLMFLAGLSTAEKVSEVSGRGVGMDVVKSKIEAIGGSVLVSSEVGKGTKVIISLPLTLAIIQAMLVKLGGETYAIPLSNISRIIGITSKEIKSIKGSEVINLFGEIIPLVRLHGTDQDRSTFSVVIVERGMKKAGLVVDSLMEQREIVIKSLDETLSDVKGISGATILGDGKVILILDTASIVG